MTGINESTTSFHESMKEDHHTRSARQPSLRCVKWRGLLSKDLASSKFLKKGRPVGTTWAASFNCPMSTSSWCFVMEHLVAQCSTVSFSLASLSLGSLSSLETVSISIPRKVSVAAGPSTLECSTGAWAQPSR